MANLKSQSRHGHKQRFWQAHLGAWAKSGLSQNRYCRQNNLQSNQFCYWKKKLTEQAAGHVSFVPVPVSQDEEPGCLADGDSGLTLYLDDGIRLEIKSNFNGAALSKVVAALRR